MRNLTRKKLEVAFENAQPDVPPNMMEVQAIEEQLYKDYSDDLKEYLRQVAKLQLFLDPKHYIGQFANLFRSKILQDVYPPERIAHLDIPDMLPEVFLNPKATQAQKLDIFQNLNRLVKEQRENLEDEYKTILDPSARREPRKRLFAVKRVDKMIEKNHVDVKDLCENPYWKVKKVNMIICKENGKFYCLDIQELLTELAKNGTATNYFTKKPLPQEIINNLRARYSKEITEIKGGEEITLGKRTEKENVDLEETLKELEEFQEIFNEPKVLNLVELFGLDSVDDPRVGEKGTLDKIPPLIQEEFEVFLDTMEFKKAVEQINLWLDSNIDEIKKILGTEKEEDQVEKVLNSEPIQLVPEESPEELSRRAKLAEQKLIKEQILVPDTVSTFIYNYYINRLRTIFKTVYRKLKTVTNIGERDKLQHQLADINKNIKDVRERAKSIEGILSLLESALTVNKDTLESITEESGMGMIYPEESTVAKEEQEYLLKFNTDLEEEINYLEQLMEKLMRKYK